MSEKETKTSSYPVRVLLVDNDKDLARAMHEALDRIGLNCTMATSGPEGAKLLEEHTYDIVVTDLMMNDVDGMGILKLAKDTQPECEVISSHRARDRSSGRGSDARASVQLSWKNRSRLSDSRLSYQKPQRRCSCGIKTCSYICVWTRSSGSRI